MWNVCFSFQRGSHVSFQIRFTVSADKLVPLNMSWLCVIWNRFFFLFSEREKVFLIVSSSPTVGVFLSGVTTESLCSCVNSMVNCMRYSPGKRWADILWQHLHSSLSVFWKCLIWKNIYILIESVVLSVACWKGAVPKTRTLWSRTRSQVRQKLAWFWAWLFGDNGEKHKCDSSSWSYQQQSPSPSRAAL